jgi:hypothetical protein
LSASAIAFLAAGTAEADYVFEDIGSTGSSGQETFISTVPSGFESADVSVDFDDDLPAGHSSWSGNHNVTTTGGMSPYDVFSGVSVASYDVNNDGVSSYTQLRHDTKSGHKVYDWYFGDPAAWRLLFDDPVDSVSFLTLSGYKTHSVTVRLYSDENFTNQIGSDLSHSSPNLKGAVAWAVTGSGGEPAIRSMTIIPTSSATDLHNIYAYTAIPEPATLALLGLGGLALTGSAVRRRK